MQRGKKNTITLQLATTQKQQKEELRRSEPARDPAPLFFPHRATKWAPSRGNTTSGLESHQPRQRSQGQGNRVPACGKLTRPVVLSGGRDRAWVDENAAAVAGRGHDHILLRADGFGKKRPVLVQCVAMLPLSWRKKIFFLIFWLYKYFGVQLKQRVLLCSIIRIIMWLGYD